MRIPLLLLTSIFVLNALVAAMTQGVEPTDASGVQAKSPESASTAAEGFVLSTNSDASTVEVVVGGTKMYYNPKSPIVSYPHDFTVSKVKETPTKFVISIDLTADACKKVKDLFANSSKPFTLYFRLDDTKTPVILDSAPVEDMGIIIELPMAPDAGKALLRRMRPAKSP